MPEERRLALTRFYGHLGIASLSRSDSLASTVTSSRAGLCNNSFTFGSPRMFRVGLHITLGGGFHTSQISEETLGNHENPGSSIDF